MGKNTRSITCLFLILSFTSCTRESENSTQGYIEGDYTYIATPVPGILESLMVDKGDQVKKGQLLFILDKKPESDAYLAAVEDYKQLIASRDALAAELVYAKLTYDRDTILVAHHALQQSELDNARSSYESYVAKVAQADALIAQSKARLEQSKWTLEQKFVSSPVDGIVFDKYYRVGEYTIAQQSILALLAPNDIKAIFYVNESVIGRLRLKDKIILRCDKCIHEYIGYISFISPSAEYTPPVIYSNETNEKLIFRIEAKFAPKDAVELHPGQPVYVTYHPNEK